MNGKKAHGAQRKGCVIVLDGEGIPGGLVAIAITPESCDLWFEDNDPEHKNYSHYERLVLQS